MAKDHRMTTLCIIAWVMVAVSFLVLYVLKLEKNLCCKVLLIGWALTIIGMFFLIKKKEKKHKVM